MAVVTRPTFFVLRIKLDPRRGVCLHPTGVQQNKQACSAWEPANRVAVVLGRFTLRLP
ncbi:unnamed protein product [Ectocarpus sp. 8 AP-2014]